MTQTTKITLTRALALTKTLKKELESFFTESRHMYGVKIGSSGDRTNITGVNLEGLQKLIKSDVDKLKHKLKSYTEIKQKIFQTNANTFVEINGSRMTIQDAIILKDTIKERKKVLENLKIHQKTVASNVSREQKAFDDRVEAIINALTDKTASPEQIFAIRERTRAEQTALCGLSIVDSCNVDGFIIELEKEIKAIELDLDTELSIINSNTLIEVEV